MTITEAFADPTSLMKNQSDYEDLALDHVRGKGELLGSNDLEGRPETLWFKTQAEKDDYTDGKS